MIERPLLLTLDFVMLAAHLGMYYMKQNHPADALKSLVMIGSMGRKLPLFAVHRRFYLPCSLLGRPIHRTAVHRGETRRVGSNALPRSRREWRKHPDGVHPSMVHR